MQQSDFILREIEKISIMLMGMLGKMVRRKKEGIELSDDEFITWKEELKDAELDIDAILSLQREDYASNFITEKGYNEVNIELLADLLAELAPVLPSDQRQHYYLKALDIYNYCDESFKTFSLSRQGKVANCRALANKYS